MKKYLKRFLIPIVIILSVATGLVIGYVASRRATHLQFMELLSSITPPSSGDNKISSILSIIDEMYVDSIQIDTLTDAVIPKLMGMLDPHSTYIPAKDFSRVNESLDGEFDGIGVVFNMATDTVIVLNVINAGPSAKAGVMARDRIVRINDSLVAGRKVPQDSIVGRLRGKRGTKVKLGIERAGVEELVDIEVVRGKIPINSIGAKMMIQEGVGYINMSQFSRTTYNEFINAINELLPQDMHSLILDLRGNSGGYMDQAIMVATEFLPEEALIVYTEDRNGKQDKEYTDRSGQLQNVKLVVLIDEGSASSSEIVAGALQDNDRGTIIGRRSFGKGLVQRQIALKDGSAIRITTSRYFTPTGRSIQKPYTLGEGDNYEHEILERFKHDEFYSADSIAFADSLKFVTPKGKVVYGGGGIMPDIFVPVPKEPLPKYYIEVSGKNTLYRYTIEYSDRHRDELAKISSFEDLENHFDNNPMLYDDFVKYATKNGHKATSSEIGAARDITTRQLRAFIGQNTSLKENGYYINIYPIDNTIMRALDELSKN